jgi:isorenieratene synthase
MGVVIVGGGVAGLTAAYRLAERGIVVTLLEAEADPGGQARAFVMDGVVVEHGSHALFGYYRTIVDLIDELRCDPALAATMPGLERIPGWTLVDAYGRRATLKHTAFLPGVLGALPSILRIPWLSAGERVRTALAAFRVLHLPYSRYRDLDRKTSLELGREIGYPEMGLETWNAASLGLTDLFVSEQSGAIFAGKHKVLLGPKQGLSYLLPTGNLSDLIANPLVTASEKRGVRVIRSAEALSFDVSRGAARAVVAFRTPSGLASIETDHIILAVQPWSARKLLPWVYAPWTSLKPVSPILTMVVGLSGRLAPRPPGQLAMNRTVWAFSVVTDLSLSWPDLMSGNTVLRCEIGHADRLPRGAETPLEDLVKVAKLDIDRLYPEAAGMTIEWARVHRETKHLYVRWGQHQWGKKPTERDVGRCVYLAGDWTSKGTIGLEAAANSGIEAANHVLAAYGQTPIPYRDVPL